MVTEGEGRVTLALLGQKLDQVLDRLERMERNQCETDDRVTELRILSEAHKGHISNHAEEIKTLRGRDTAGSLTTGIMAVIAGLIAWLKP